ncbi:MarR family winged helix-turn-helix transcriptional regulator [Sphingomonas desiccabilis]|nr:MarR family winged helix-turn-helix transcriptional regulator [Sphingomonas desiccabilis]MBB3910701.1 DNA-binding MarR family transcriptional regulator [Sphingomonas desiccabilis]
MTDTDSLISDFGRLFLRLRRIADAHLAGQGVSVARMKLLMYLRCEHNSPRAADIASVFGHSPRTVSEAIEGLERDGLVRRTPDPMDRRVKRISLTSAGEAAVAAAEPLRLRLNDVIFGVLDEEERSQFREMLAKLGRAADALEEQGGLEPRAERSKAPGSD